ncbi:hypothetical protein BJ741DRAFT_624092 [Chytriomyces cf. hyalinus JEL632]|nr:hypothetical protein BJ741DRAFT_624092 [Chytriomyces cf. hyalinus JEL632]
MRWMRRRLLAFFFFFFFLFLNIFIVNALPPQLLGCSFLTPVFSQKPTHSQQLAAEADKVLAVEAESALESAPI